MKSPGPFSFRILGCHLDTFLASHWGRAPFSGTLDAATFADLPSFGDIVRILVHGNLPGDFVRVLSGTSVTEASWYSRPVQTASAGQGWLTDGAAVTKLFRDGNTVVVAGVGEYFPSVGEVRAGLEAELRHPVDAYIFAVPAATTGLGPHSDYEDTFIVQMEGRRTWRVYEPKSANSVQDTPLEGDDLGPIIAEITLYPGTVLYVPSGFPHDSAPTVVDSVHLNLSVAQHTWSELVTSLVSQALEESVIEGEAISPAILRDEVVLQEEILRRLAAFNESLAKSARVGASSRYLPRQRHSRRLSGTDAGPASGSPVGSDCGQSFDG